ncbi:hypothetical protein ACSBR2_034789 [Camellia fascicularis]
MTVTELSHSGELRSENGCSSKEKNHLIRSTKKIKKADPDYVEEDLEENNQIRKAKVSTDCLDPTITSNGNRSFKQALLRSRFNEVGNENNLDCDVEDISSDEEDNTTDTAMDEGLQDGSEINGGIPNIRLPAALLKKIREPWKKCLIVRLLGKTIGYKLFMTKMTKIWSSKQILKLWTLGIGFS